MSALLIGVASLLVFFLLVSSLPFGYAVWRRVTNRGAELEIWQVMRRLGISPEATPHSGARMAHAIRRCVICPSLEACDHWLASGKTGGIDEFCPNTGVLEDLRRR